MPFCRPLVSIGNSTQHGFTQRSPHELDCLWDPIRSCTARQRNRGCSGEVSGYRELEEYIGHVRVKSCHTAILHRSWHGERRPAGWTRHCVYCLEHGAKLVAEFAASSRRIRIRRIGYAGSYLQELSKVWAIPVRPRRVRCSMSAMRFVRTYGEPRVTLEIPASQQ
jgi:hypothetical protein